MCVYVCLCCVLYARVCLVASRKRETRMRDALRVIRCVRSAGAIELAGIVKEYAIARTINASDSFAIVEAR